jgi:hypothetical protein
MNLNARIKIIDSKNKIEGNILKSCENELKNIFSKARPKIHSAVINLVIEALQKSPEIISLQAGTLKTDFGLDFDPTETIIYAIANSTYINFKGFRLNKNSVTNILSVYIQPSDFKNILSMSDASVLTDKGQSLPWLEWLLLEGDAIIVTEYHVEYGAYESSRSGGAIMKPSGVFRVNPAYSGTAENNFITRALASYGDQIKEIVRKSI